MTETQRPRLPRRNRMTPDGFWAAVSKDGPTPEHRPELGPCWLWLLALTSSGYGTVISHGKSYRAHRLAYEFAVGPIPEGLQIDHLCRNRGCVNPAHLEPVTPWENAARGRGLVAINLAKTHCPQGHPYSGDNLVLDRNGSRKCYACHRIKWNRMERARYLKRQEAVRQARLAAGEPVSQRNADKTHCIHGHEYTPENTHVRYGRDGRPYRRCRTCFPPFRVPLSATGEAQT